MEKDTITLAAKYIEAHKAHAEAWAALGNISQLEDAGDQSLAWQSVQETRENDGRFIAAANPQAILGLIADYERLEEEADWLATAWKNGT